MNEQSTLQTPAAPATVRTFAIVGYESDRPSEHLETAARLLDAARKAMEAMEQPNASMSHDEAAGLSALLGAIQNLVDLAAEQARHLIKDPYAAGYRAGTASMAGEYRRGFREGHAAALAENGGGH